MISEKESIYCGNFKFHHCSSCHADVEYGYALIEDEGKDFILERCCTFPKVDEHETRKEYLKRLKELGIGD